CPLADEMMGATAETLAERYGITRDEQDAYAVETQRRAGVAYAEGRFDAEIVPLETLQRDEHPRFDADLGSLAKLPPVFRKNGTVHAGNSSGITDGAASMLVASGDAVKAHNLAPMARIVGYAQAGVDPKIMGIGPVPATLKLLAKLNVNGGALDVARRNDDVWAAAGFNPHEAKDCDDAAFAEVERAAFDPRVVAIGECGLDYHYMHSPRETQIAVLERHIDLARRLDKPI